MMGTHSTLRITRKKALEEYYKANPPPPEIPNDILERFMDELLDKRLYNAIIVPDGDPENEDYLV